MVHAVQLIPPLFRADNATECYLFNVTLNPINKIVVMHIARDAGKLELESILCLSPGRVTRYKQSRSSSERWHRSGTSLIEYSLVAFLPITCTAPVGRYLPVTYCEIPCDY